MSGDVEVQSPASGGQCGLSRDVGDKVGLLLHTSEGRFVTGSCNVRSKEFLEASLEPLPPAESSGPVRLLVAGAFGSPRAAGLDARGRLVRFGSGDGDVRRLAPCPGGRVVLELVAGLEGTVAVARRRTDTLAELDRVRVPLRGRDQRVQVIEDAEELSCQSPDGARAVVYTEDFDDRARLLRLTGTRFSTLWRGRGGRASFAPGFAYVGDGRRLGRIDLRTGRSRTLARGRLFPIAVSPDSRRLLAGGSGDGGDPMHPLLILDARSGRVLARRAGHAHGAVWLGDDRVAAHRLSGRRYQVEILDSRLRTRSVVLRSQGKLAARGRRLLVLRGRRLREYGSDGRLAFDRRVFSASIEQLVALPAPGAAAAARVLPCEK